MLASFSGTRVCVVCVVCVHELSTLGRNCLVVTIALSVLGDLQDAVPHVMVLAPHTKVFTRLRQSVTE